MGRAQPACLPRSIAASRSRNRARLQGAGVRLPCGRQRRREHARPLSTRRATRITRRSGRRHPASTSRRRSCCPSSRRAAGRPYGFHPACRPLRKLFEQSSWPSSPISGCLSSPSTKAGLETRYATAGQPVLAQRPGACAAERRLRRGCYAHRLGRPHRRQLDAVNAGTLFSPHDLDDGSSAVLNGVRRCR